MKRLVMSAGIAALIVYLAIGRIYVLRLHGNEAELLWNDHQALLFVQNTELGWSQSPVDFGLEFLKAFLFRAVTPAFVSHRWLTVVQYAGSDVTSATVEDLTLPQLIVMDGFIYDGSVRKWTGKGFEPTTATELERLRQLWAGRDRYAPGDGWRLVPAVLRRAETESRYPMTISGNSIEWIVRRGYLSETISVSIGHEKAKTVWSVDEHGKFVNRREHERVANSKGYRLPCVARLECSVTRKPSLTARQRYPSSFTS